MEYRGEKRTNNPPNYEGGATDYLEDKEEETPGGQPGGERGGEETEWAGYAVPGRVT